MKEDAYLLCKKSDDGLYIPQTNPVVLTGSNFTLEMLLGYASENDMIVVLLSAK